MELIQVSMAAVAVVVTGNTHQLLQSDAGKVLNSLPLFGPLFFLPMVWQAWRAPDITVLRSWTWPLMVVVNLATFISVCHSGSWQIQVCTVLWTLQSVLITTAILVRPRARNVTVSPDL